MDYTLMHTLSRPTDCCAQCNSQCLQVGAENVSDGLGLGAVGAQLLALKRKFDQRTFSAADFTVLVSALPHDCTDVSTPYPSVPCEYPWSTPRLEHHLHGCERRDCRTTALCTGGHSCAVLRRIALLADCNGNRCVCAGVGCEGVFRALWRSAPRVHRACE